MKKSIKDANIKGQKVLVRVDFNEPVGNGELTNDWRIKAALPTLRYLLDNGNELIIMTHLGRPEGKAVADLKLDPVARRLEQLINHPVLKLDKITGKDVAEQIKRSRTKIVMLENLRFDPREESNDPEFAQELADLGDVYVNDAFANSHREHASVTSICKFLPAYAGLLMSKEIEVLTKATEKPARPLAVLLGGAKISTKFGLLEKMLDRADTLILGGGIANTILAAMGKNVGKSLQEPNFHKQALDFLEKAKSKGVKVLLPEDAMVTQRVDINSEPTEKVIDELDENDIIADIGPKSVATFTPAIDMAGTIIWNGPFGVTEFPQFSEHTEQLAKIISETDGYSIVGGGDTLVVIDRMFIHEKFGYVSTGGGAMLEFLEGKELPGIACLPDA